MSHRTTIFYSFAAMVIMIVLYALTTLGYMGDNPVGQTSSYNEPMIVPASYAFSIWSIIYLGLIAFPFYQWFNRQEGHALWHDVRRWYGLNVIANGVWLVFASYDWLILTLLVILFMLYSLYRINDLLITLKTVTDDVNYWAERLVFSLYFAWITLASALNVSTVLSFYNWSGFGIDAVTWSIIILPVIALIAYLVFRKYRDIAYAAVVIWAFVALIVKHLEANPVLGYIAIAVIILFAALIFTQGKKWAVRAV